MWRPASRNTLGREAQPDVVRGPHAIGIAERRPQQLDDLIFDLLRKGARLAVDALSAFSSLVAEELSDEGASRRQIARLIGVSHQRVSAILGRGRRNGSMATDSDDE